MIHHLLAYLLITAFAGSLFAAPPAPAKGPKPLKELPTFPDVAYGTDLKQKFDVYCPPGDGPFPVIFYIHGGGWFAGDRKGAMEPEPYLKKGVALVSIEYRLINDATAENISPPITAVLGDTRRALQYVRLHAADWHLDPDKIIAVGGSAGAASALYLACEGEQANPASADPVERVSTKIVAAVPLAAQTSIDPQHIQEWNPGCAWGFWACEPPADHNWGSMDDFNKYLADRDKWLPVIKQYSMEWLVSKDTPPIYFGFGQKLPDPGTTPKSSELIHSPLWAIGFMKIAEPLGVKCYLQYPGHPVAEYKGGQDQFILQQLGVLK